MGVFQKRATGMLCRQNQVFIGRKKNLVRLNLTLKKVENPWNPSCITRAVSQCEIQYSVKHWRAHTLDIRWWWKRRTMSSFNCSPQAGPMAPPDCNLRECLIHQLMTLDSRQISKVNVITLFWKGQRFSLISISSVHSSVFKLSSISTQN